jgi:dihydroxy-acid dehydratase
MNKPVFDKSNLPSRHVSVGPARAPHRSFYYAMGMTAEEIAQPFVGVATCWNEAAPCNISLNRQAQAAKIGVKHAAWDPAGIHHNHSDGRDCHGSRGDALLSGQS